MTKNQTIFWDVDTQIDFIRKDGKLAIEGAEAILPNLEKLTEFARKEGIQIVASTCDHELGDAEISQQPDYEETYPPHCMRGTEGQLKVRETRPRNPLHIGHEPLMRDKLGEQIQKHDGEIIVKKKHFDVFSNPNTTMVLDILRPERIIVYGVALDVCDKYAIEGFLRCGGSEVILVQDATRAIHEERRSQLLEDWKRRGVKIVNTPEVVQGKWIHETSNR